MIFVTFCTQSFMNRTNVLIESIKKYHPEATIDVQIVPEGNGGYLDDLPKKRFRHVKKLLEEGKKDIVLIGADCVLYGQLYFNCDNYENILLTPHVVYPPKERGAHIYATGYANGDLVYFRHQGAIPALNWLLDQEMVDKQNQGIFYEQTWLSALPFIFEDIGINRDEGVNLAWYNLNERKLRKDSHRPVYWVNEFEQLKMIQYSGFIQGNPDAISKHYNKVCTDPVVLELFRDYNKKIS